MITTVTLNPAIDREYFVQTNEAKVYRDLNSKDDVKVTPGGKGLIAAINLRRLGNEDVQNIGFVGGRQGLFFEKMVREHTVTTNYIYTNNEIRNNVKIIGNSPHTYSHYNDYTFEVEYKDEVELLKRFKRSIKDSSFVLLAGSIPKGIGEDIYKRMIRICNEEKKDVYLNASENKILLALEQQPKVVAPYFKQKSEIFGQKLLNRDDYEKIGKKLIEDGAQHVILPYGCNKLLFQGKDLYVLSLKDFCLASYLGSGDAFSAAFIDYVLKNGFDFLKACTYGAAAAMNIMQSKDVFLTDKSSVECLVDKVNLEKI